MNTTNPAVLKWVNETAELCQPDKIYWCNGSEKEKDSLTKEAVAQGVLIPLNQKKLPGCYLHRSNPNDVARSEQATYICTPRREEAGPTNNWAHPTEMYRKLRTVCAGAMRGRTMYVVPYLMGPPGSPLTKVGVELTDSIYVALSMRVMTRMGDVAYEELKDKEQFNRGLHCMLDVHPDRRYICNFPHDNTIISVGSNYGGNVLLGKKCLALRIGSWLGKREGWLAEHMLIVGIESPDGQKTYITAAFPSASGKTNVAMMIPPPRFKGWKVWTIGDDIAWMKPGPDGRLYAINPEAGYFGVVPGTNRETNPNAMAAISHDTIYTNVALLPDGDVWWEGKDGPVPKECIDWKGNRWTPDSKEPAAHPNSRFTAPMSNNPALAPEANDPKGVPISAIIFGARRPTTMPLVYQAFNWIHGVYVGATMGAETTAAALGAQGVIRRDPMAMLPFCGYHMGDYFAHWLSMRKSINVPPRIFHVNWFRKDETGKFLWPGFGENMRVLKWIVERCQGRAAAEETPLGWVPGARAFDLKGMQNFSEEALERLQSINTEEWRKEVIAQDELFLKIYSNLPKELIFQRELLVARL
ncbi:MAG TPA: phosphoenolpyruvate carboxykinase (GTP) [Verrucomicrobiae bacterium]|nr:phosphoenolpyruvate carboxykinase (GTP) [Verrucomicrobiae bacterium]